ncbi:uncharacterized protein EDB93DRAFT_1251923 [Suillus bovinus]|uniref:uncharacterized protein n=1 Tax=Suillus bovinus TaxID=48563 RepID=UPI001B877FAB|nr:uncharacterized protein EDB93DRAFT_1251923 [Suillus bovinus]KAG2143510.1 hypothetical protein EDB93DRAFT_1251923 [Suillus bovinus]
MSSSESINSDKSTHSLCSCGTIDQVELKKGKRKPAASWTSDEEAVCVDFLLSHFSASGDGNFKTPTLTAAANLLKERFSNASGAEKTASVCKTKWQSLKSGYNAVLDIKNTSGFMWSDEYGVGIVTKDDDVWNWYIKWRPAAKPFKNKEPLAPSVAPIGSSVSTSDSNMASPTQGLVPNTPGPSRTFNDPSSITPSTPSSHLASPNATTAVQSAASNPSMVGSESSSSARKCTRPLSVTAQAQKDGNKTMKVPAGYFDNFYVTYAMKVLTDYIKEFLVTSPSRPQPVVTPNDPLAHAIVLLSEHKTLAEDDRLEIADYFAREKVQAVIFSNFPKTA